ncbi:hypothetical protein DSECCO2_568950 [anaerobic digester metagenome]
MLEAAGHRILAADRAALQRHLGVQCTQERRQRLAPANVIAAQPLEIFLERQPAALSRAARGNHLGDGFAHRRDRARIGVAFGNVGVKGIRHQRGGVGLAMQHRNLRGHRLNGGFLIFSAEGEQHGTRTDRGVKALGQALLRADVEVRGHAAQPLGKREVFRRGYLGGGGGYSGTDVLLRAVRI